MYGNQYEENPADFESREAADRSVYVKFYITPVHDEAASAAEGRPMYRDREYVEIRTPGQQNNVIQRPVTDMDRQRFRQAYRKFKEGEEEQVIGTPLSEVPWITRSQVEELAHIRVRTLEHLAALDDSVCSRFAGLYSLKQKAQKAMEKAISDAPISALQAQIDELKNLAETQAQTIKDQSEIIASMKAKKG